MGQGCHSDANSTCDDDIHASGVESGSGGARGYAHIGVTNESYDRGHQIVGISGSSAGALVGGLEAPGKLNEYAAYAGSLTYRAALRLPDRR